MTVSNYDKFPSVTVPGGEGRCVSGWDDTRRKLNASIAARSAPRTVLTVECYTGVHEEEILEALQLLNPTKVIRSREAFLPEDTIDARVAPFNGGEDPIFGWISNLRMADFMDPAKRTGP